MNAGILAAGAAVLIAALVAPACEPVIMKCPHCDYYCGDVVCENANEYVKCDPSDGLCKCGSPDLMLVCGPDEVCTPQGENAFACVRTHCERKACAAGETCQLSTGECTCGSGPDAAKCESGQTCENGRCKSTCAHGFERCGLSCEPTGTCCGNQVACDPNTSECCIAPQGFHYCAAKGNCQDAI